MNHFERAQYFGASVITIKNLPPATTEQDVSEWLWTELGWNVPPEDISSSDHSSDPWATVVLSRVSLADYLNRLIAQGVTLCGMTPRAEASAFGLRPGGPGEAKRGWCTVERQK